MMLKHYLERKVTKLFRNKLRDLGSMSDPWKYDYTDGELWWNGHPRLEEHMTPTETQSFEHALQTAYKEAMELEIKTEQ